MPVSLCLDNDEAGMIGMDRVEQTIRQDPALSGRISLIYPHPSPKEYGKDYNEMLVSQKQAEYHEGRNTNHHNSIR